MLIPLEEARAGVLDAVGVLPARPVPLAGALGLAVAEDVVAAEAVPPFASSAMDGYALRAVDTAGASNGSPVRLAVVGELPAGRAPTVAVGPGQAIRIMTGAPVPDGADAVVMVERTEAEGDSVLVHQEARVGDHVREAGGDVRPGDLVLPASTVLGPAHLGVLASLGRVEVLARPRARVGVLSTGDELVEGAAPLAPGQIRDSNRPMLLALVAEAGCEPVDLGTARDDQALITSVLERALDSCDAVLTSGGVSVGDYDFVKAALDHLAGEVGRGGTFRWSQVAIKPAKPLAFGVIGGVPVFGLPGNPVSSLVSFELFARPALLQAMGHPHRFRPEVPAVAGAPLPRRRDGKLHLDRVRLHVEDGRFVADPVRAQASNALAATAAANGLALVPDGEGVEAGEAVRVLRLDVPADH